LFVHMSVLQRYAERVAIRAQQKVQNTEMQRFCACVITSFQKAWILQFILVQHFTAAFCLL